MLNHLDLFSGIGGFAYGFEQTGGIHTAAFVEINPFCQKVLRKHWPRVPIYKDIRSITVRPGDFDIMSGGFPCQDVSKAADLKGGESILGDRSGLWFQFHRLIKEAHPTWVVIENVEVLINKGLGIILSQLATLGYDAEWRVIRACDVGLPHVRKRVWVIAHAHSERSQRPSPFPLQGLLDVPWAENGRSATFWAERGYLDPSPVLRTRDGIPDFVDRTEAIGNSVVPQIAYLIGDAILEYHNGS